MDKKKKPTTFEGLDDKDTDLTMFTITNLNLYDDKDKDKNNSNMVVMTLKLKRKVATELLTTYLPTILLLLITFTSIFFDKELFGDVIVPILGPKKWHFEWPNQNSKTTFIVQTFPKYCR